MAPPSDTRNLSHDPPVRWALTLIEPLIPTAARQRLDADLLDYTVADPSQAATFYAGVTADMIGTLTDRPLDQWKQLSGRLGRHTHGANPPSANGAVRHDGQPFGTFADIEDRVELVVSATPELDTAFAHIAYDQPRPETCGLIALAGDGWETAQQALIDVHTEAAANDGVQAAGQQMIDIGTQAIRLTFGRRRLFTFVDDAFAISSCWSWAWNALQMAETGNPPNPDLVREEIEDAKVPYTI